jgi:hypothetical protein
VSLHAHERQSWVDNNTSQNMLAWLRQPLDTPESFPFMINPNLFVCPDTPKYTLSWITWGQANLIHHPWSAVAIVSRQSQCYADKVSDTQPLVGLIMDALDYWTLEVFVYCVIEWRVRVDHINDATWYWFVIWCVMLWKMTEPLKLMHMNRVDMVSC